MGPAQAKLVMIFLLYQSASRGYLCISASVSNTTSAAYFSANIGRKTTLIVSSWYQNIVTTKTSLRTQHNLCQVPGI